MYQMNNFMDDRAVSEVVGFILIFGIVVLSIGMIYTVGYPILSSNMEASVFESSEQSFVVLQSNMETVAFNELPVKTMKFKLYSSSLGLSNKSNITIDYPGIDSSPQAIGTVEYGKNDKRIVYENGAVFKYYPGQRVVLTSAPPIFTSKLDSENITTITVIRTSGNSFQSGSGVSTLKMSYNNSSLTTNSSVNNLTITINSEFASLWKEYLEENDFSISSSSPDQVVAHRNDTYLIYGEHLIDVDIN
ncbi:hypothetical protein BHR79_06510 [Methanohalophilus halophilus]|nr:hypothetical protein BHR79_06510 [Methanohalophilus halophilus]RNI09772.1 hypothetical protein EFE40_03740 [Methanohalophilus halophilus]